MRAPRRLLGEIFLAHGIIWPDQLTEALRIQKYEKPSRIGLLLVELGYATELQLVELLAEQLQLPSADLSGLDLSPAAIGKVPKDLAVKHRCVPWQIDGRDLHLLMADPTDMAAMDAIRFRTGLRVRPVVAAETDVLAALTRCYSDGAQGVPTGGTPGQPRREALDDSDGEPILVTEGDLQRAVLNAPVANLVNCILADAVRAGASDVHIEPQPRGTNVRYRIDGALRQVVTLPPRAHARVVSRIKVLAHLDIAERRRPQDGRTRIRVGEESFDLRISTLPTADGEKVVIRLLARRRATIQLEDLGFEEDTLEAFRTLLRRPQGLILVTGPTGAGKTSTLYAALNFLTCETTNIVTIEDPVEYRLPGINQVAVLEKAGLTFAAGLRSILRQDPNVVMVGEIRDPETAQVAFHAAQTGHLVLSTLHTNDAPSTVTRLVDIGIPGYLVASSVIGVLAQRLVRTLCLCRVVLSEGLAQPCGCDQCHQTGFRGRVAIHELLRLTPHVRAVLMESASTDAVRRAALASGMRSMFEDGQRKVARGITTLEEITRVAPPPEVDDSLQGRPLALVSRRSRIVVPGAAARPAHAVAVLVVDHDGTLAATAHDALGSCGCDVRSAPLGPQALAAARQDPPDLVIVGSDDAAALHVLRGLKADGLTAAVPVILVGRPNGAADEVSALDAGADDYLHEPLTAAVLLRRVQRLLGDLAPAAGS